jgi:hypothetical protein
MQSSMKQTAVGRSAQPNGNVWLIVALSGAVLMAVLTLVAARPPFISPDSGTYLDWSPTRTPGYPFFLSIVKIFSADFSYLPYVQMMLLVASTAFLAQATAWLGGYWWIWALMGAGILGNPFLWRFAWQMQSESLFVALVTVFLGGVAMALRRRPEGLGWLATSSVALGAAILVRPVGYALLGVALVVGVLWYGRRFAALLAATMPAIAMLLAVSSWNFVSKGYFATQIFGGYNILGQVALLVTPEVKVNDPILQHAAGRIADELSNVGPQLPRELGSWKKYYWMTVYGYNTALQQHALPAIEDANRPPGAATLSPLASAKRTNTQAWSIALATIQKRPVDYIYHVLINFVGLWTLPGVSSAANFAVLRNQLCDPAFRGFYCGTGEMEALRVTIPADFEPLKDGLLFGFMVLSFVLILAALLRPGSSPLLIFAAVAALCVNANHLLVSLVEAGIPRYAIAMWPALLAMIAASAAWLSTRLIEK